MMSEGVSTLFTGKVIAEINENLPPESIKFKARFDDFLGEIFDYEENPDPVTKGVTTTLTNKIESPVNISKLKAELHGKSTVVLGRIQWQNNMPPGELAPDEQVTFVVAPAGQLQEQGDFDAVFDLDEVEILPDKEKLWDVILSSKDSNPSYSDTIEVRSLASMDPSSTAEDAILAIKVDFKNGDSVMLEDSTTSATTEIRFPIRNIILEKTDSSSYSFLVTVYRKNAIEKTDWLSNPKDVTILVADEFFGRTTPL
jgi:hypothetical protein